MSIEVLGTFNVISKYTGHTPGTRNRECMPVTIETRVKWRIYGVHVPIHKTCHAVCSTFHTWSQTQERQELYSVFRVQRVVAYYLCQTDSSRSEMFAEIAS